MNFIHGYQQSVFCTKKKHVHIYAYAIPDVRSFEYTQPPGRLHGRGRLHGSNVLTCCTWARTRRVGVISDGRYYGLLR